MATSAQIPLSQNMIIDPARANCLVTSLANVSRRVAAKASGRHVRLVAVSKLKPPSDIMALYNEGHRHFGENYFQELEEKASILPKDIKWHFIGGLQSIFIDKCKPLASNISNLYMVSSIDTAKKATQLNVGRASLSSGARLNIHIQVNTSSEVSKSGTSPGADTINLALHILKNCPHLYLCGLMTIGAVARSAAVAHGEKNYNPDFKVLHQERDRLEEFLRNENDAEEWQSRWGAEIEVTEEGTTQQNHQCKRLEISMGMSEDFELAIEMGSTEVRVGSTIFGQRT